MRYFDLAGKAKIKISDDKLTLKEIKNQLVKSETISKKEIDLVIEIDKEEFLDNFSIDHLPTWQEIVDILRERST